MVRVLYISCIMISVCVSVILSPAYAQFGSSNNGMLRSLFQITNDLERQGRIGEAILVLEPYQNDPRIVQRLYQLHETNGTLEDFLPVVADKFSESPVDVNLLGAFIRTLASTGRDDSLRAVCESYASKDSTGVDRFKVLGSILSAAEKDELAVDYYLRGREELNDNSLYSSQLADLYLNLDENGKAVDELLINLQNNPGDLPVARRQAFSVAEKGGSDADYLFKRIEYYSETDTSRQFNYNLQSIWMEAALTTDRDKDAVEALNNLFDVLDKPMAEAQFMLFVSNCEKLEKWPLAIKSYDLAMREGVIDPEQGTYDKADLYFKANMLEQAEAELLGLAGIVKDPDIKAQTLQRLGNFYLNFKNDPKEALSWYNRLQDHLEESPAGLVRAKLNIADSFIHLGELDKAREIVVNARKVSQGNPENMANSIRLFADILFYEGKVDSAMQEYLSFAKLGLNQNPANDAIERAYLINQDKSREGVVAKKVGEALFRSAQGKYQQAYDSFSAALELIEKDDSFRALIIYQVGRMYEQAGEYPLAISAYEQLAENFPEHHLAPFSHLAIGKIYLEKTGNPELARKHLEKVVFDYPEGVATGRARRFLRSIETLDLQG